MVTHPKSNFSEDYISAPLHVVENGQGLLTHIHREQGLPNNFL